MKASRMAAIVLVVLVLAYPLSIGPVARYHCGANPDDSKPWSNTEKAIYSPITFACEHCTPIQKALTWYSDLWLPEWARFPY